MNVTSIVGGAAALAAICAAGVALTGPDASANTTMTAQLRPVVFSVPLPLEPPPAPPAPPAPSGAPLPTSDEVAGMLTRLTDAGIGYKEKGNLVENGIEPSQGHVLDHELRKSYRDGELPYTFNVSNVEPAGPGKAAATVTISGPKKAPETKPVELVDQGGWVLSHDSAEALVQVLSAH